MCVIVWMDDNVHFVDDYYSKLDDCLCVRAT